jgi:hypothetical protein
MKSDGLSVGMIDTDPKTMIDDYINEWRDAYPVPEPKVYVSRANYERLLARAVEAGHTEEQLEEQLAAIVEVLPDPPRPAHPRRGGLARLT